MSKEVFIEIGSQLGRLRMYPVFDICHYLLTALQVRDDIQQHQAGLILVCRSNERFGFF